MRTKPRGFGMIPGQPGSSTDLVPTLLSMYDSLIAQSLSSEQLGSNHRKFGSADHNSSTENSSRVNQEWINSHSETTKLQQQTKPSSSSHVGTRCMSSLGDGDGHLRNSLTKVNKVTQNYSNNNYNPTGGGVNTITRNSYQRNNVFPSELSTTNVKWTEKSSNFKKGSSDHKLSCREGRNNKMIMKTSSPDAAGSGGGAGDGNRNGNRLLTLSANDTHGKEQRPLSVNSTLSTTSSSSTCSSEGSSSASGNNQNQVGVAPRASPEEDVLPIPDADLSEDEGGGGAGGKRNSSHYRSAKTTDQTKSNNNETERCFNNSASKDGGETGSRTSRISYPIPAAGRPRFCDPNLSYMDRVVMEIVETERLYVNDLHEIISGYLEHWLTEADHTLPVNEIQELFSNIEEIHHFNSEFLEQLEGCGLDPIQVAECFVIKNEGFSIYTEYCTNYPRTMSILTEMMRQEQSAKSFRERQASLGHTLPLGSYLLKPVQRILKYHLLLQNIVKHYDHVADGYDTIVEALSAMTNIAHHINDMKRRHEHAVRVQEIQSLLYGWQGEDLTTYGELCAEGAFRVYGAKAVRHVFLFDKMLLITKKKDDGILCYKSHITCSNLMLIESVPGEPLSFHVIPFDNPRLQCTLQARNLDQKREWTLQLKRVILENYHAVIPSHARQLVMELGQSRPEDEHGAQEKTPTKRQHSAPEYLERRKQEKDRRKSESSLKARLRRGKKDRDPTSPKESPGGFRRSRRTSMDNTRDRSESRDREVAIDRKMSSASCPPCGTTEKRLVKKLSGWRRKSEPGFYLHPNLKFGRGSSGGSGGGFISRDEHGHSNMTLDSNESIGEEDVSELESASQLDLCREEMSELDESTEQLNGNDDVEERRESIEEIVGQLVMQNRDFQRILNKQRLVHLRKALAQHQERQCTSRIGDDVGEESASETETEEASSGRGRKKEAAAVGILKANEDGNDSCVGSQVSSSNGIGSSSDVHDENSSGNVCILPADDDDEEEDEAVVLGTKNVQRTVSDPGNKATLTPRRFMNGPFGHYDPIALLWSSFRRTDRSGGANNRSSSAASGGAKETSSPQKSSKGKTNIRHTHSFTCSHKETGEAAPNGDPHKDPLPLPHGDSGVFPNSFTSDSSSSSEANIPTLPSVWLKQQDAHLATPNNKSGSLPRSFQVCQTPSSDTSPKLEPIRRLLDADPTLSVTNGAGNGFKARNRDGKYADRPFTIASDKPSTSDISYDEMEQYMNKFNDEVTSSRKSPAADEIDDLVTEITPITSMENLSLHPDHKIYRSSKSSIKHLLMSVTHRLSGIKTNISGNSTKTNGQQQQFGSHVSISPPLGNAKHSNSVTFGFSSGSPTKKDSILSNSGKSNRKSLKQKIKQHIVREDRDSDCENCESATCSSASSGFGSVISCASSNNLTSKIGARLAQCSEPSDFALSKILGAGGDASARPQSVMSVSSTVTSASSTDEKTSSGFGGSLSESNNEIAAAGGETQQTNPPSKRLYRLTRKGINHGDLYLSYIDQDHEVEAALSDSDASADSFYERSFEAIENFLENEMFPDSAIYSDQDENASSVSSGSRLGNWCGLDELSSEYCAHQVLNALAIGENGGATHDPKSVNLKLMIHPPSTPSNPPSDCRRSRLVRSQVILEKLKHLEECTKFHRDEHPSPSFEGLKTIQERRKELDLWRCQSGSVAGGAAGAHSKEDESETSSQHSTSTINTVIELSPTKSTSFPSSRRCSDTDSSGGNSPLTERAISRSSSCHGNPPISSQASDPMPKGWVKLLVGKLQNADETPPKSQTVNE